MLQDEIYLAMSALQKSIRRGDETVALRYALELERNGLDARMWQRLLVISAEDCFGPITAEIAALRIGYQETSKRVFVAKAVLVLVRAVKCRDADHALLAFDAGLLSLSEHAPDYAYDCHTRDGLFAGRTKEEFYVNEHSALENKAAGLLDWVLSAISKSRGVPRKG
jgi:replication-associated recombination protein RarA